MEGKGWEERQLIIHESAKAAILLVVLVRVVLVVVVVVNKKKNTTNSQKQTAQKKGKKGRKLLKNKIHILIGPRLRRKLEIGCTVYIRLIQWQPVFVVAS